MLMKPRALKMRARVHHPAALGQRRGRNVDSIPNMTIPMSTAMASGLIASLPFKL
jgi:hypothetical protein